MNLFVSLVSVQFLFRQYSVIVIGDTKGILHQTRVIERDRHSQSFLFHSNPLQERDVYKICMLTFGATSSPTSLRIEMRSGRVVVKPKSSIGLPGWSSDTGNDRFSLAVEHGACDGNAVIHKRGCAMLHYRLQQRSRNVEWNRDEND